MWCVHVVCACGVCVCVCVRALQNGRRRVIRVKKGFMNPAICERNWPIRWIYACYGM